MWIYVFAGANFEDALSAEPPMNGLILSTQWTPALGEELQDIDSISRRFGLNQRCKRFSLVVCTREPSLGILAANPIPLDSTRKSLTLASPLRTVWNINDIRTHWTMTSRSGTNIAKDLS